MLQQLWLIITNEPDQLRGAWNKPGSSRSSRQTEAHSSRIVMYESVSFLPIVVSQNIFQLFPRQLDELGDTLNFGHDVSVVSQANVSGRLDRNHLR